MTRIEALIRSLAHGRFVSGEVLGQQLNISRSAVWKHAKTLKDFGLELQSVRGKGYRLAQALELLDVEKILSSITPTLTQKLSIHSAFILESTNAFLLERAARHGKTGEVCLGEYQTAGRGRRGRPWISPLGSNIYLSVLWSFPQGTSQLGGLSLAVGVMLAECLDELGLSGVELKWPNDLYYQGKKLGGILIEVRGESGGPCQAVIGVGLNVNMPEIAAKNIDQPWSDLASIDSGVSRNETVAAILQRFFSDIPLFIDRGLQPFVEAWKRRDALYGKTAALDVSGREIIGQVSGINEEGHLLLDTDKGREVFSFGEISLSKRDGAGR